MKMLELMYVLFDRQGRLPLGAGKLWGWAGSGRKMPVCLAVPWL